MPADPTLILAEQLIACPSITPDDAGCLPIIETRLQHLGFRCEYLNRGGVTNLWARRGDSAPLFCFAGHTDVVPVAGQIKIFVFFFIFSWVKATVPRYRYDQLMRLGWKIFLPTSLVAVVITSAWRVFAVGG